MLLQWLRMILWRHFLPPLTEEVSVPLFKSLLRVHVWAIEDDREYKRLEGPDLSPSARVDNTVYSCWESITSWPTQSAFIHYQVMWSFPSYQCFPRNHGQIVLFQPASLQTPRSWPRRLEIPRTLPPRATPQESSPKLSNLPEITDHWQKQDQWLWYWQRILNDTDPQHSHFQSIGHSKDQQSFQESHGDTAVPKVPHNTPNQMLSWNSHRLHSCPVEDRESLGYDQLTQQKWTQTTQASSFSTYLQVRMTNIGTRI